MKKSHSVTKFLLLVLLGLPFSCSAQNQSGIFTEPFSSLSIDDEMPTIKQGHDTLYNYKCSTEEPCEAASPRTIKKIEIVNREKNVYLLYMITINSTSQNRASYLNQDGYWIIKKLDANRIKQYSFFPRLIQDKKVAEEIFREVLEIDDKFGYTLYSQAYLKSLVNLKAITTMEDVEKITNQLQSDKYSKLAEMFSKAKIRDNYASGFFGELITLVCLELGYNPVRASIKIDEISRTK